MEKEAKKVKIFACGGLKDNKRNEFIGFYNARRQGGENCGYEKVKNNTVVRVKKRRRPPPEAKNFGVKKCTNFKSFKKTLSPTMLL